MYRYYYVLICCVFKKMKKLKVIRYSCIDIYIYIYIYIYNIHGYYGHFNFIILYVGILSLDVVILFADSSFTFLVVLNDAIYQFE